jgi:ubiquinol-cytochrome c reductase cytochrome c subunit
VRGTHQRHRAWLAWLIVIGAAAVAAGAAARDPAAAQPPPAEDLARGGVLYQQLCAVCHATDGTGTRDAPPIADLPLAYSDLLMRTGRMPLVDPERGVRIDRLTDDDRELVVAYLAEVLEVPGDIPDVPPGDASRGQDVYVTHCVQCHGAVGEGGVVGARSHAPPVRDIDPVALVEATRIGPFDMPPFAEETIGDDELGDLVAYLTTDVSRTSVGLVELDRPKAAALGAVLLLAAVGASVWATRPIRSVEEARREDDG